MKILITGASGFIGQKLIEAYSNVDDIELFGLSRKKVDNIKSLRADILSYDQIEKVFKENCFDVVFHLAAITEHAQIIDNKFEAFDINMSGTKNILKAFNKYCNNALFVYSSTGKVYGETNEMPISENALVNPTNILGKTKYLTERLIDFYAQENNKYLVTRIFNIYGERQKSNFVLPTILGQLKDGNTLRLGNVEDKRDYLYIDDLINALMACEKNRDKLSTIEYFNIGSGTPTSVKDILSVLEDILNIQINIEVDQKKLRHDETSVEYCDNSKLKNILDWEQEYSLKDGLAKVCREEGVI